MPDEKVPEIPAAGSDIEQIADLHENIFLKRKNMTDDSFLRLIDEMPALIWRADTEGKCTYFNKPWLEYKGRPLENELGDGWLNGLHPEDRERTRSAYYTAFRGRKEIEIEYRMKRCDGEYRWIADRGRPYYGDDGSFQGYIGICCDINDLKEYEAAINSLAYFDPLTGLPNRNSFVDRCSKILGDAKEGQGSSVLVLELDRLNNIIDSLGYEVGERLIQEVAERLKTCIGEDGILSRLGGNEFTVMLPGMGTKDCVSAYACDILDIFEQPYDIDGYDIYGTANIGISIYPYDGRDIETLIRNANTAVKRLKGMGQNYCRFFSKDMASNLHLVKSMKSALEKGEFLLVYQPKIHAVSGEISGMEALIRWSHPILGRILPGRFISLAEDTGIIIPLGEWVLEQACRQLKEWQEINKNPTTLAINLSPVQLRKQGFSETVKRIIKETGVNPQNLEFEITESAVIYNFDVAIKAINEIKGLGIKISMDDFGTGYSSLTYLSRISVDSIKIDMSFIRNLSRDSDRAIVSSILAMAGSLNLAVTAEGVEKEEQAEFLRDKNCDYFQGYLFYPPLTAAEMERILVSNSS